MSSSVGRIVSNNRRGNGKRADSDDEYYNNDDTDDYDRTRRGRNNKRRTYDNDEPNTTKRQEDRSTIPSNQYDEDEDHYYRSNSNNKDRYRGEYDDNNGYMRSNDDGNRYRNSRDQYDGNNDNNDNNGERNRNDNDNDNDTIIRDIRNRFRKLIQECNGTRRIGRKQTAVQKIGLKFRKVGSRREVTMQEFFNSIQSLYQQTGGSRYRPSKRELDDVVDAIDADQNGKVSFSELMSFITFESRELRGIARDFARGLRARGSDARTVFNQVATGQFIDKKKFTQMLRLKQMTDLSVAETSTLLNWFDTNGDGKIDVSEFVAFMENYTTSLMLTMKNEVSGFITDLCISSNKAEENTLVQLNYVLVAGGFLNTGTGLTPNVLLWKKEAKHDTRTHFSPRTAITDIIVHNSRRSTYLYANGFDVLRTSSNSGIFNTLTGAKHQYIWFKRRNMLHVNPDAPPILDMVVTSGRARKLDSALYNVPSSGYVRVDANFNEGSWHGPSVFVWIKKADKKGQKKHQSAKFQVAKDITNLTDSETFKLADRARLAFRTSGISSGNPAQLFIDEGKKRWTRREFRWISRRKCNIAIGDKHMGALFHYVDHDNDGFISLQDFTLFVQLTGHHLHSLGMQLRISVLGESNAIKRNTGKQSKTAKAELMYDTDVLAWERNGAATPASSDISRLRGALDQIYDDSSGTSGRTELGCSSLSELLKKSTGISLTVKESSRLMNVMLRGGLNNSRDRYSNMEEVSNRKLSREEFHNFFEHGVHPGKSSQRRIASAAVVLQDYIRHVAIAKMSIVRKSKQSTFSATNAANGSSAAAGVDNNASTSTSKAKVPLQREMTIAQMTQNDNMILTEGAKAAWRAMDPAGEAAVPVDQPRTTLHLQNCLSAATSWMGESLDAGLSHHEFAHLSEIIHPGSKDDTFSFNSMCRFANVGPGSTTPITSVVVTRTQSDNMRAFRDGLWRANYFTSVLDISDDKCDVQIWFERKESSSGELPVAEIKVRRRNSRGTRNWTMAEQPINDRAELHLFYRAVLAEKNWSSSRKSKSSKRQSRSQNRRNDDYDDIDDSNDINNNNGDDNNANSMQARRTLVSVSVGSKQPGRIAGHAVFTDNTIVEKYNSIDGSEMLLGKMEFWVACSEQPIAVFAKHERIADGFKVGDNVLVKRTGFLQTGDGTVLSNKHKGDMSGVVVAIVLNGNAGGNVKWSRRKPTYDIRDTLNGTLLKGVAQRLMTHVVSNKHDEFEVESSANPRGSIYNIGRTNDVDRGDIISQVRRYVMNKGRLSKSHKQQYNGRSSGRGNGRGSGSGDGIRTQHQQKPSSDDRYDLISIWNDITSNEKSILVTDLALLNTFRNLPPLRTCDPRICTSVTRAMGNKKGEVTFIDFVRFCGVKEHQLTVRDDTMLNDTTSNVDEKGRNMLEKKIETSIQRQCQEFENYSVVNELDRYLSDFGETIRIETVPRVLRHVLDIETFPERVRREDMFQKLFRPGRGRCPRHDFIRAIGKLQNHSSRDSSSATALLPADVDIHEDGIERSPLSRGVEAIVDALRLLAEDRSSDLNHETSQWIKDLERRQTSGTGRNAASVLIGAASDIDCTLRRDEANALLQATDGGNWNILRRLIGQWRGRKKRSRRDPTLGKGTTLLEIVDAMKRVVARMHTNGQDFHQLCEARDPRSRGRMSKQSLRQVCRDVGMILNTRELLILEKAFAAGDNLINYESMYSLLAPTSVSTSILRRRENSHLGLLKSGTTTMQSLRQTLVPRLNPSHGSNIILQRFNLCDKRDIGEISYQSFLNVCNRELKWNINREELKLIVRVFPGRRNKKTIDHCRFCREIVEVGRRKGITMPATIVNPLLEKGSMSMSATSAMQKVGDSKMTQVDPLQLSRSEPVNEEEERVRLRLRSLSNTGDVRHMYASLDPLNTGKITKRGLEVAFRNANVNITHNDLDIVASKFSESRNYIDYETFVRYVKMDGREWERMRCKSQERLNIIAREGVDYRQVFTQFDRKGAGFITLREFENAVGQLGLPMLKTELYCVVARFSHFSKKNLVSYTQFLRAVAIFEPSSELLAMAKSMAVNGSGLNMNWSSTYGDKKNDDSNWRNKNPNHFGEIIDHANRASSRVVIPRKDDTYAYRGGSGWDTDTAERRATRELNNAAGWNNSGYDNDNIDQKRRNLTDSDESRRDDRSGDRNDDRWRRRDRADSDDSRKDDRRDDRRGDRNDDRWRRRDRADSDESRRDDRTDYRKDDRRDDRRDDRNDDSWRRRDRADSNESRSYDRRDSNYNRRR